MKSSTLLSQRIARILEEHSEVRRIRLDPRPRKLEVAFYEAPSDELLQRIQTTIAREFAGSWDVAVEEELDPHNPFHQHRLDHGRLEFHREHLGLEPRVIWKAIPLPSWENRPVQPVVAHHYSIMLLLAGICGAATLTGFLILRTQPISPPIALLFVVAYLSGGWFATEEVWSQLKRRRIDVHFLMIVVALGALLVNAWVEGATLLFLFSLSNALEQFANYRTEKTLSSLLKAAPKLALRRSGNEWVEVPVEDVGPEDELLVKPGELFPVDGILIEGATSADESALTGESLPVGKQLGDMVSSGTLNIEGQAIIRVLRPSQQSALHRILELIETAQQQKAPAQRFTDAFSRYYTWVVLSLSALTLLLLLFIYHQPPAKALYRTMTLLVVASPCALVLSIPSAILVAIAAGARQGILFRGGVAIENLAGVTQFAFDKTGTLTKGTLRVARFYLGRSKSDNALLQTAASIGQFSSHPLSRAVVREAEERQLSQVEVSDFRNLPGLGMEARLGQETIFMGSRRLLQERGATLPGVESSSEAEVWLANGGVVGAIFLRDEIRPAARGVIEYLKNSGASITLLTGDRIEPAQAVAAEVGIEDVRASVSPEAKLRCISEWRATGKKVAMVGDGINDAPSLTAADVAIGMGARGSDAALEQADVILMHDKIENVEQAVDLSRRARRVIRQNIVISLGVILVLVTSALAEKINLTLGVIGHEGSTVIVILNGLRLLRTRHTIS